MVLRSKSISLLRIYLFLKKRKKGEEEKEMKRRKKITVTDSRKDENPREFTSSVEQRNSQP